MLKYILTNIIGDYKGFNNNFYELVRIYIIFMLTFIRMNTIITIIKNDYIKGGD